MCLKKKNLLSTTWWLFHSSILVLHNATAHGKHRYRSASCCSSQCDSQRRKRRHTTDGGTQWDAKSTLNVLELLPSSWLMILLRLIVRRKQEIVGLVYKMFFSWPWTWQQHTIPEEEINRGLFKGAAVVKEHRAVKLLHPRRADTTIMGL